MGDHTQLTQEEQYQIYLLKKAGDYQANIADMLAYDKSQFFHYVTKGAATCPGSYRGLSDSLAIASLP